MTTLCPACWREVSHADRRCSHCGADIVQLHERDFRDKLLGALSHPNPDIVIRVVVTLATRRDPAAVQSIEAAMARFTNEPHVLAGLLNALTYVGDDHARRIANQALAHRSFIVRRAAAQALEDIEHRPRPPG